jgi:hypothetical protein
MIETISALHELQKIDSKLDEIVELRGDLPEQIQQMEHTIAESQEKFDLFNSKYSELEKEISTLESEIEENNIELKKDEENLYNVQNNKEYDALTTQINARKSVIDGNKEKIEDAKEKIEKVKERKEKYEAELSEATENKEKARGELDEKVTQTEKDEKSLTKKRKKTLAGLHMQFQRMYTNIRRTKNVAVATMSRQACSGCHSKIPLQKQNEIRNRKKIIVCETCGRIILDSLAEKIEN